MGYRPTVRAGMSIKVANGAKMAVASGQYWANVVKCSIFSTWQERQPTPTASVSSSSGPFGGSLDILWSG
jgi:hypothetical protein